MVNSDINSAKKLLIDLVARFSQAVQGRGTGELLALTQKDAAQKLREVSTGRGTLLRAECDEGLSVSKLSQDRVSLLLRYRNADVDPDGKITASLIADDLHYAAITDNFAVGTLCSLGSFEPLTQETQDDLKQAINTSLAETKRLAQGCMGGPLSEDEVKQFHAFYETPSDPLLTYRQKTEALANSMIKLTALTGARVDNTLNYVDCIDYVVVPAFPDHAEGMLGQAAAMLQEAVGSFERMHNLIQRAETYMDQLKKPPVRGPQP